MNEQEKMLFALGKQNARKNTSYEVDISGLVLKARGFDSVDKQTGIMSVRFNYTVVDIAHKQVWEFVSSRVIKEGSEGKFHLTLSGFSAYEAAAVVPK